MSLLETFIVACQDVEELKKGGQRMTYKARHPQYGMVVIKYIQCQSVTSLERISREAELLASLESPGIPKMYEFEVDSSGKEAVTVEEYIPGDELEARKRDYDSEEKIIRLLQSLIRCMRGPWALRVVHRDLKPTNILITPSGQPYVIDFGIARFLDKDSLTRTEALIGPGTPIYAAPEQLENRKASIDIRTDFFALGVISLELYLGTHPFAPEVVGGESIPANIVSGRYLPPTSRAGTSQAFVGLVSRLLQVQPYLRFRTPEALESYIEEHWGCNL